MQSAYVVTGTLTDRRTVALDEAVDLETDKVRVIIEPLSETRRPSDEVLAEIWTSLEASGHTPRPRDEVDAELARERDSWEG